MKNNVKRLYIAVRLWHACALLLLHFCFLSFNADAQGRKFVPGLNKSYIDIAKGTGVYNVPAMIYVSPSYFTNSNEKFALLFSYHTNGAGEYGKDTVGVLKSGIMYHISQGLDPYGITPEGDTVRFIVVAAQRASYSVDPVWTNGMFEDINTLFGNRLDSSRFYLYGASAGGWGVLGYFANNKVAEMDTSYGKFISAMALTSGATQDQDFKKIGRISKFHDIPFIAITGRDDVNYKPQMKRVADTLNLWYKKADTILIDGTHSYTTINGSVAFNARYSKLGVNGVGETKNIFDWFVQYTNGYVSGSYTPPDPNACNTKAPKSMVITTNVGNQIYYPLTAGSLNLRGGDTAYISAGYYSLIDLGGLRGDSCRPIVIRNKGGQVVVDMVRFGAQTDTRYIKFIGDGDANIPYGFKIGATNSIGIAASTVQGLEIAWCEIEKSTTGIMIKKNPVKLADGTYDSTTYGNGYTMKDVYIHHNYLHDIKGEGMYLGHTDPNATGGQTAVVPIKGKKLRILYNTVESCDWDGIQTAHWEDVEIGYNKVKNYGLINKGSQQAGIILGGNTTGTVHHNTITKGTGNGIQLFGYGDNKAYNNTIDSAGINGSINGQESVYCNDIKITSEVRPPQKVIFENNVIKNPQPWGAIRIAGYQNNSVPALVANNSFCLATPTANWEKQYIIINVAGSEKRENILSCLESCNLYSQTAIFYKDADSDGFGTATDTLRACTVPNGYASVAGDCNDANAAINPDAVEVCDGIDNNCNGQIDEGVATIYYRDADADGFGNDTNTVSGCSVPLGYVATGGDCNDSNLLIHPNAVEVCNGKDDDCDGEIDEACLPSNNASRVMGQATANNVQAADMVSVEEEFQISIMPMPAYNTFNIKLKGKPLYGQVMLRILDANGREVEKRMNVAHHAVTQMGAHLAAGVYYLEVSAPKYKKIIKLIKQ